MNTNEDPRQNLPSASGAQRLINCAGSRQAEANLPELPPQKVTADGTAIHGALESGSTEGLGETEVQIAERLSAMEKSAVNDWMRTNSIEETPTRNTECRLWIRRRDTLELVASAQLDVFYISGESAIIIDFKSGFATVTAADKNFQLLVQCIALRHEYPQVKDFFAAIAAARLKSSFDMARYSANDVDEAEKELHHAIWLSKKPNPRRVPGTWCQYCRANGQCAEAAAYSSIVLHMPEFKDTSKLAVALAVSKMTPQQMAGVYIKSKVAAMIFDAVESRLKNLPPDQLEAIGLGLKPGAERRSVSDYNKARASAITAGLTEADLDSASTLGVTKVQDLLKKHFKLNDAAAKARIESVLESTLVKTQNQPSLTIK